ncbi:hypothetical protein SEA_DAUDAU_67 [Streptomyces phage Daudau]|uniref:Uncharacterized protein n=1 Tax=Streptomyces phage Daudau TaxID=2041206 RepID=A0A291LHB4_9CAUD|nr:hypothetical protein KGG88_gp67 [Streptomyces phage Daudau]ATI18768.1 hypothetical protein SEA_DAUDAU_67 [Streptomyces phage Daudau]
MDTELMRHIRTLRLAGLSYSQMVKWGVALLADVYRAAWQYRVVPFPETPELQSYIYAKGAKASGPPFPEDTEETPHEEAPADRDPDRRRAGLPDLELPGLGLAGLQPEAGDPAGEGEVRPGVPHPYAAVR